MTKIKAIRVTFSNGKMYNIPAEVIAEDRADYYATKFEGEEGTYDEIYEKEFNYTFNHRLQLLDWMSNNMNWEDVSSDAKQVETEEIDKSEEFVNAEKTVIQKYE